MGFRYSAAYLADALRYSINFGFITLVLLAAITMLVRHRGAAVAVFVALFLAVHGAATGRIDMVLAASIPTVVVVTIALLRFGIVGLIAAQFAFFCTFHYPLPVTTSWWTGLAIVGPAAVIALAVWAFRTSLGGRSAFGENAFAD
jgi:hypothetical protein